MPAPDNINRVRFIGTAASLPTLAELKKTVTAKIGDYTYEISIPENFGFSNLAAKVKSRYGIMKEMCHQFTASIGGCRYRNNFLRFLCAIRNWCFPAFVRMDQKVDSSNLNSIRHYLFEAYAAQAQIR
ncbi:hypothetical protein FNU76_14280 [Chitinimonas arctica]|uniref:Uncharacterized protein n=1 Tax=Chitinimonas arctica TaxID=2594795 RepID=A0A516SGY4_9NEIS|nr:hypothetical protein [Chitinimonas arctica]QDQ27429.1 hypothetical protein FNU76_14280 [Chitinimonas arctica]